MKVVFLSYSDFKGGASIAAYSIFKAINNKKIFFLTVENKYKKSISIFSNLKKFYINLLRILEKILIFLFDKKKFHQSLNIFNTHIQNKIENYNPDIINLHWVNRSMISLNEIYNLKSKLIFSLHDMWIFSPTQHYFIKEDNKNFISRYCWNIKQKLIYKKNVFFIVHNKWMLGQIIKRHPKLKNKIFLSNNYPVNTNLFKPRNKIYLRKKYKLPLNKIIIFFSAQDINDERKGFKYFMKIVKTLSYNNNLFFLSLGGNEVNAENYENYKHVSFISNERSSELYSLSDIFLCTSTIDNLPLTILEALSSGNLVISFDNGGAKNVLKKIGYVYKISKINNLIKFINNLDKKELNKKSIQSRKFAKKYFDKKVIASSYNKIFEEIYNRKI